MASRIPRKRAYTKADLTPLPKGTAKKTEMPDVDHVIIDADSPVYAIAWAPKSQKEMERLYDKYVTDIMEDLNTPEATVYVRGKDNFRYDIDLNYKSARKARTIAEDYQRRIDNLYAYAQEHYGNSDGAEADDYCSAHHDELVSQGKVVVLSHIDKDLNMIPGYHWNPTKKKLSQYRPEMSYNFLMRQLMMGDGSDSIKGLPGIGPKKALDALHHKRPAEFWKVVQDAYSNEYGKKEGQKVLHKMANLLYIRQNYDDFRPLTWEEINDRLSWRGPDDGELFLAQMDIDAMALELDHDIKYNAQKGTRWWGEIQTTSDTGSGQTASKKKNAVTSLLRSIGASSTKSRSS